MHLIIRVHHEWILYSLWRRESGEKKHFTNDFIKVLCVCPHMGEVRIRKLPFGKEGKGTQGRGMTQDCGPSQSSGWPAHMLKHICQHICQAHMEEQEEMKLEG